MKNFSHSLGPRLELIIGPMCSSKTTTVCGKLQILSRTLKCLYINSLKDTRSETDISSHNTLMNFKVEFDTIKVENLCEADVSKYEVVAIDEQHMFSDLEKMVKEWFSKGKYIIVAGLSGDFKRNLIGDIHKLFSLANTIIKIESVCSDCSKEGIHTPADYTITTDIGIWNGESPISVGGAEKYVPCCNFHYTVRESIFENANNIVKETRRIIRIDSSPIS